MHISDLNNEIKNQTLIFNQKNKELQNISEYQKLKLQMIFIGILYNVAMTVFNFK